MICCNRKRIAVIIAFFIIGCCLFYSCDSQKKEVQNKVEEMQSTAIKIPYERMACWTNDSVSAISIWDIAKLKLVHYVDSAMCSSCFLQKAATDEFLHRMKALPSSEFCNVFIISPGNKTKKKLETDFREKRIPQTIFVDTANVFMELNPNIPGETMYHTFLLDENNKVILVGNPMSNQQVEDMMLSVVEEKLGKKINSTKW